MQATPTEILDTLSNAHNLEDLNALHDKVIKSFVKISDTLKQSIEGVQNLKTMITPSHQNEIEDNEYEETIKTISALCKEYSHLNESNIYRRFDCSISIMSKMLSAWERMEENDDSLDTNDPRSLDAFCALESVQEFLTTVFDEWTRSDHLKGYYASSLWKEDDQGVLRWHTFLWICTALMVQNKDKLDILETLIIESCARSFTKSEEVEFRFLKSDQQSLETIENMKDDSTSNQVYTTDKDFSVPNQNDVTQESDMDEPIQEDLRLKKDMNRFTLPRHIYTRNKLLTVKLGAIYKILTDCIN